MHDFATEACLNKSPLVTRPKTSSCVNLGIMLFRSKNSFCRGFIRFFETLWVIFSKISMLRAILPRGSNLIPKYLSWKASRQLSLS